MAHDDTDRYEDPEPIEGLEEDEGDQSLSLEVERSRAVEEVLADQAAKEQLRMALRRRPGTTMGRVAALAALSAASLYAWFISPVWLDPAPPPPVALEHERASLRFAMYIQAQRIEAFREERGRLPDVLEEAGEPLPGMRYDRLDARTYRLRGSGDRTTYLYVSSDSLSVWAGDATAVLGLSP
ncbi:MAG TPA: hypothetical protein VGA70_03440 [Longimicrobiales bacterium]|jgi:hypothetical protein